MVTFPHDLNTAVTTNGCEDIGYMHLWWYCQSNGWKSESLLELQYRYLALNVSLKAQGFLLECFFLIEGQSFKKSVFEKH